MSIFGYPYYPYYPRYDYGASGRLADRHLSKLASGVERLAAEAKIPNRTPVQGSCPKCPSELVNVTYQATYRRSCDQGVLDRSRARQEKEEAKRQVERAEHDAWLALPKRKRRRTPEPLWSWWFHQDWWMPNARWYLDEKWDVEHLLYECNACGWSWREPIEGES